MTSRAAPPRGAAGHYPKLLDEAIAARTDPPSRAVWMQLSNCASNSVSGSSRERFMGWNDVISKQETRVEYDKAMARGDFESADSIACGLGEDGWTSTCRMHPRSVRTPTVSVA